MRKYVCFIVLLVLLFSDVLVMAADVNIDVNMNENIPVHDFDEIIEESISENVIRNNLYDENKIKKIDDFSDSVAFTNQMIEDNSRKMNGNDDELFVENCIILKTSHDIVFDTSKVVSAMHYDDIYYIQYDSVQSAIDAVEILRQYPTVEYAEIDSMVHIGVEELNAVTDAFPIVGKDGMVHQSWGVIQTGLDILAEYVYNNAIGRINIAVVDNGIYSLHPLLQGRISNMQFDLAHGDNEANDETGHGTFVAGIIVDAMQRLNVNIIPVKVTDANADAPASRIARGINEAVNAGADVINISLAFSTEESHSSIDYAISNAIENDVVVVVASGNDDNDTALYCPAHISDAIVVSNVDKNKQRHWSSNFGDSVDVAAPGTKIKSSAAPSISNTGYAEGTGTSFAAPHITAVAAMLRLLHPTFSATSIQNQIRTYTVDIGTVGLDDEYGTGFSRISDKVVTVPFTDVSPGNYFYEGVYSAYARGYMTGKSNTIFAPTENMQRQDVALIYYRMAREPHITYRYIYPDVASGDYFAKAAVWAHDNNILKGMENGFLGVGENITREAFALTLFRFAKYRGLPTASSVSLSEFVDGHLVSDFAEPGVKWAVEKGLMGQGGNQLRPQDPISRADIAVMIYRFLCL